MALKNRTRREGGFTLIELISVIIILGILAAVVVPKYFDMTGKAQDAAYKGALNEGLARFNMAYAQYILQTSSKLTAGDLTPLQTASYLGGSGNINIGDYDVAYSATTSSVTTKLYKKGSATQLKDSSNANVEIVAPWPQ